jgi:hypothetical protein
MLIADFPLGTTDASVIAVVERLGATHVATIDHRHFRAIRPALRRLRATACALTPERPTDSDNRKLEDALVAVLFEGRTSQAGYRSH